MSFRAQYSGQCPACEQPIDVGDLIVAFDVADGETAGYMHLDCDDTIPTPPPAAVCPRCNLTIAVSGACGCDP